MNCHTNIDNDKIKRICNKSDGKSSTSKTILANTWCNGLMHKSKCKTSHEANITASVALVETCVQRDGSIDFKAQHLLEHLNWWLQEANIAKGRLLSQNHINKVIATDVSNQGWGRNLDHQIVQGSWSTVEKQYHINCLEMEAVTLTLRNFLP